MNVFEEKISHLYSRLKAKRLLVFCGAGISANFPSNIPVANKLVSAIRKRFLGKYDRYIKSFEIRPEVLFQIISKYESKELFHALHDLLASNVYNSNHQFLAKCLKSGNSVITTNFDNLIESACKDLNVNYSRIIKDEALEDEVSILFKIHGSIDSPDSVMFTINHINKGLSEIKFDNLQKLTHEKTILVLGYSGNDQLDIMPALRSCRYEDIIWINHDNSVADLEKAETENNLISSLERLEHYNIFTDIFVNNIDSKIFQDKGGQLALFVGNEIPSENKAKITVDILKHHSAFSEIPNFIERLDLDLDMHLKIEKNEAESMLGKITPEIEDEKAQIFDELLQLPLSEQIKHIAYIVKSADIEENFYKVEAIVNNYLATNDSPSDEIYEAILEMAFRMILHHQYEKSEKYLQQVLSYAKKEGNLLLEARAYINYCGHYYNLYNRVSNKTEYLLKGIEAADKAIFLLGKDIFNDKFFFYQAKNNKAIMLRNLGKYDEALELYFETLEYYKEHSIDLYIQTMLNISTMYLNMDSIEEATYYVQKALKLNKEFNRSHLLGLLYRQQAEIYMEMPNLAEYKQRIISSLQLSIDQFRREGNMAELKRSESLLEPYISN